ncbi:hypothetical protein [Streptomyces sp. NPDC006785]|uniref:hypothetical protein n=1 Tax=unclassified Streptomyces TaxID=2593676 RepID=UPI0033F47906
MTFDARKIAAAQSATPFEFIGMDGQRYELPNINTLTGAQGRRLKAGDDSVLEEIATEETQAAMDALPLGVQEELSRAWVQAGGESGKGASPSSRRPKRPKASRST